MKLFHTLLYPLLGLLFLSCSDNEQETGDNPAPTTGTITFGVDLTGFTTRVTQDGTSWTNGDKIGTFALDADTSEPVLDNVNVDRKSTRLNSSHIQKSRMPSSA